MSRSGSEQSGKILLYVGAAAVAALCLVGVIVVVLLLRSPPRETAEPIPSPDGTKFLVTRVNRSRADPQTYLDVEFDVLDEKSGAVRFHAVTTASARMKWSMHWIGNHEVELASSDVGDLCWKEAPGGSWASTPCPP